MSHKIFENDIVTIRKNKVTLTLHKLAYIGMFILELNKLLMYEFHYDYIKKKYGNNSELISKNTDSSMCEIETEDVCKDFNKVKEIFDFGSYLTKSKYYVNLDCVLVVSVNYKRNIYLNNNCSESIFFKYIFSVFSLVRTAFLSSILDFINVKYLKIYE